MEEKCFCHLNGFAVKDATARKQLEELNTKVNEDITQQINELDTKVNEDIAREIEQLREDIANDIIGALEGGY